MRTFEDSWQLLLDHINAEAKERGISAGLVAREHYALTAVPLLSDLVRGDDSFAPAPFIPECVEWKELRMWFQKFWIDGSDATVGLGHKHRAVQKSKGKRPRTRDSFVDEFIAKNSVTKRLAKELFKMMISKLDEDGCNPREINADDLEKWECQYDQDSASKHIKFKTFQNKLSELRKLNQKSQ